jgi:hypothetical protein
MRPQYYLPYPQDEPHERSCVFIESMCFNVIKMATASRCGKWLSDLLSLLLWSPSRCELHFLLIARKFLSMFTATLEDGLRPIAVFLQIHLLDVNKRVAELSKHVNL